MARIKGITNSLVERQTLLRVNPIYDLKPELAIKIQEYKDRPKKKKKCTAWKKQGNHMVRTDIKGNKQYILMGAVKDIDPTNNF